jgi:outer membrane protein
MKWFKIILFLFIPLWSQSQPLITLRAAVDSAMKNNFDIRIARNSLEIKNLYNTYGEAGGLPSVNITGSANQSENNTYQKTAAGEESTKANEAASSVLGGVTADWTLFNGFKVIATKEKLNILASQGQSFLNQQIQNTLAAVMLKYYDIIRQEAYLQIELNALDYSKKKLEITRQRLQVGLANEADLLQSQIDVNMMDQSVKSQELIISQAKTDLLQIIGVKEYFEYDIKDTLLINRDLSLDTTLKSLERNPEFVSSEQQVRINEQIVKEINSQRYPNLKINTSYDYSLYNSQSGNYTINQNYGPTLGASIQIPIFNGLVNKNHHRAAKYEVQNARLEQESVMNSLKARAIKTYQSYITTIDQLENQQESHLLSGKLLSVMLQRFKFSQATILDMKAAQESYEKSGYLLVNLLFAAKASEIEIKLLSFRLGQPEDF